MRRDARDTTIPPRIAQSQDYGAGRDSITVLTVEDDPELRGTRAHNLLQDALGVLTAAEGDGRLTLAREELNDLDLVVLDVMLPGISGFHVMRWLCSEANIPILMLAGRGEEQDRTNGQPARRPGERIGGRVREYLNAEEGRIFRQGVVALPLFGVALASGSPALSREADLSALT